jgi:hypothetical protein
MASGIVYLPFMLRASRQQQQVMTDDGCEMADRLQNTRANDSLDRISIHVFNEAHWMRNLKAKE